MALKINSRYTFVPEMYNSLNYDHGLKHSHGYLRFLLIDGALAKVGDWKLGVTYRYRAPTLQGDQLAGSVGALGVRPQASAKFGSFEILLRNMLQVNMDKSSTQWNISDRGKGKGNTLVSNTFEVYPTYNFTENFGYNGAFIYIWARKAADRAPGSKGSFTNGFEYEQEFDYSVKSLDDLTIGLSYLHDTDFAKDFKLFSKEDSFNLKLMKQF
jgi:hypothetical protein